MMLLASRVKKFHLGHHFLWHLTRCGWKYGKHRSGRSWSLYWHHRGWDDLSSRLTETRYQHWRRVLAGVKVMKNSWLGDFVCWNTKSVGVRRGLGNIIPCVNCRDKCYMCALQTHPNGLCIIYIQYQLWTTQVETPPLQTKFPVTMYCDYFLV
jgi:hypothetical protein